MSEFQAPAEAVSLAQQLLKEHGSLAIAAKKTGQPKPFLSKLINIGNASANEGGTLTFTLTRTGATENTVTVQYATGGGNATAGTDYTANSGTVTFASGVTEQVVTVVSAADDLDEVDETFTVTLSSPTDPVSPGEMLGTSATGTGTIVDTDSAPTINIGLFVNTCLDFVIMAFTIFIVIRQMNRLRERGDQTA